MSTRATMRHRQLDGAAADTPLLVRPAARTLCRTLGTTALVVLQDVTLDAEADPTGRLLAVTNVRRIAAHLGISKDTTARALARLADAGLLARQDTKRSPDGEFVPSVYELHLAPGTGISLATPAPCPSSPFPPSPCPLPEDAQAPLPPVTDIAVPDDDRPERPQPRPAPAPAPDPEPLASTNQLCSSSATPRSADDLRISGRAHRRSQHSEARPFLALGSNCPTTPPRHDRRRTIALPSLDRLRPLASIDAFNAAPLTEHDRAADLPPSDDAALDDDSGNRRAIPAALASALDDHPENPENRSTHWHPGVPA